MSATPTVQRLATVAEGAAVNAGAGAIVLLYDPDVRMLGLIVLLALYGGCSRVLYRLHEMQAKGWSHVVANVMVSVFVAIIVGLFGWSLMRESYPTVLLGMTGMASWLGIDVLDPMAVRAREIALRWMPKPASDGEP